MSIRDALEKYSKSNMYPFHMPGHKRQLPGEYQIDMTEVDGVDDLHDPKTIIAADQKRMAKLYGADESFILVGGSTVGNLSAIYAACNENDKILIQRNSHKSVYNAAIVRHLRVGYINPDLDEDGIYQAATLEQIEYAIKENGIPKAVVITSPTYEGYHCNIKEIAILCHAKNIILIVDQAHGAHLGFHESFRGGASADADIVVQSLHKTLPALTQTAAIHVCGKRVDSRRLREALDIFETSSPSYVLMNSISRCLDTLENPGDSWKRYVDNLEDFYRACGELKHLQVNRNEPEIRDPGKIIISTKSTNITGVKLAELLRDNYEIETELASFSYVLAMTSFMDTEDGFERLKKALIEIDMQLAAGSIKFPQINIHPEKVIEPWEAKAKDQQTVKLNEAIGHVSAAMVCLYPPGAPIIVPGERITEEALELIDAARETKIHVTGIDKDTISVVN
ncbi:MAG: aminotransferase class I/II-fold pyridoxal phosphate-dependent enzyme [Pseudobutyrivibrio sp.]|nr:aminotransferase class I/II-fold pyridoxal phosphate-dependent enzyme [Pseudobutyrivibrio sp.]